MPLVSGVCRTASAPMLSHGGSRLNASKPEASPKTRYPHMGKHTNSKPVRLRSRKEGELLCQTVKILKKTSHESPLKPKRVTACLGGAQYITKSQDILDWALSFDWEPTASGDQQKQNFTSHSKRENMHGLA